MSSIPTKPHKTVAIEEMETWEIFREAIGRGESEEIAKFLRRRGISCNGAIVRSWMNDPDVDENGAADPHGRRNPLDEFLEVLNAIGARDARGAEMMTQRIIQENERIQADHGREELLKDRETIRKARQKAMEFLSITEQFGDG